MAGHSHWANIKHKKAANDAKKTKVITQMGRLIRGAIQVGGPDPDSNPRLRLAITKAKAQNMTNDVIDRILKKARGDADAKPMEDLTYEGYASNGVAVVVDVMSDNRNRTAPELRKLFERGGGSLQHPAAFPGNSMKKPSSRSATAMKTRYWKPCLKPMPKKSAKKMA